MKVLGLHNVHFFRFLRQHDGRFRNACMNAEATFFSVESSLTSSPVVADQLQVGPVDTAYLHADLPSSEMAHNNNRAETARTQCISDRVRLHAQEPHAGDLQHAAAPGCAGARELDHLRLNFCVSQ